MRNIKARLEKLERQIPKDPLFFLLSDPNDDVPLTPEEESVLRAEYNRLLKAKPPLWVMEWSRREAQRLIALSGKVNEGYQEPSYEPGETKYLGLLGGEPAGQDKK